MALYRKSPRARVDYQVDWAPGLGGAKLRESRWRVEPDEPGGVALSSAARVGRVTAATLEGGVDGRCYRIVNEVTAGDGRTAARTLTLRIEDGA